MKVLQAKDICYREILNGVNFEWQQGEIIALMGINGSGKSTLARVLTGLVEPTEGEVCLLNDGSVCDWTSSRWQEIGLVGQHPRRQTIGATVAEELAFGLLNLGLDKNHVLKRVRELATTIGLEGKEEQSPATLSGGERQRLVTAAILALSPSFLILDESLTMLDRGAQAKIIELLFEVREQTGQLWITHDPELAVCADRLMIIKNGKLEDLGKPTEAFARSDRDIFVGLLEEWVNPVLSAPKQHDSLPDRQPVLEWRKAGYEFRLHIDKVIRRGEFIGIVGPSGSGKTTLLESAIGLILPDEGQLYVFGEQITKSNLANLRKRIRLIIQEAGEYLIGRSVYHEIYYEDSRQELKNKTQQKIALLKKFGLSANLAEVTPEHLSGGQRQKVALAAALRTLPEVLLLDEPLLGLDAISRATIRRMIFDWQDKTILYVTHDLREVLGHADRIWLVEKGNVVLDCPIQCWQEYQDQFRAAGVRC